MPEHLQSVFDLAPRRLLVMACTATKRDDHLLLPAGERYDGPSFRLLRRWQREHPAAAAASRLRMPSGSTTRCYATWAR